MRKQDRLCRLKTAKIGKDPSQLLVKNKCIEKRSSLHRPQKILNYPSRANCPKIVDKIYRTRENRNGCKERGIRISGPKLGRPPKNVSEEEKKQARSDECFRNAIEGKFGQAKRRFSLNLVMTKLPETSITSIAITFLVVNLSKLVRQFLSLFLPLFPKNSIYQLPKPNNIKVNYVYSRFLEGILIYREGNCRVLAA